MKASKNVLQHAESSIVISDVSDSDSGIYKCVAKTELDNAEADAELIVQDVPQVCLFCFQDPQAMNFPLCLCKL